MNEVNSDMIRALILLSKKKKFVLEFAENTGFSVTYSYISAQGLFTPEYIAVADGTDFLLWEILKIYRKFVIFLDNTLQIN